MGLTATAALLCTSALAQGSAQPSADQDVARFTQLESQWNDAHLRGDADALDRLWADDLRVVVPRMTPMSKADALSFFRSGRMKFLRYETSELGVRVYADTAVVTGRLRRSRERSGQMLEDDWRFTKVYVRTGRCLACRGVSRVRDRSASEVELTRFRRQPRYAATVAAACCRSKSIGLT